MGRRSQGFVSINLTQVTQEVVSALEMRIAESSGKVTLGDLPTIDSDRLQMRQMLQNLASNALRYQPRDLPLAVIVQGVTQARGR